MLAELSTSTWVPVGTEMEAHFEEELEGQLNINEGIHADVKDKQAKAKEAAAGK